LYAKQAEYLIDKAALGRQYRDKYAAGDYPRQKVGQIDNSLDSPLKALAAEFIQKQRNDNRGGKTEQLEHQAYNHRIGKSLHEELGIEQLLKVRKADPLARVQAEKDIVILKSHLEKIQGPVLKNEKIQEARQQ